ncbi:response regulator [Pacificispira sp.]|uniref:response regulator n=1 Tax=Pacificispira sp. TaxID=2888761 RepID=UPI003BAAEDCF
MSKSYDFTNLRVLVVDDCKFMRNILERMLEALGCGFVRTASDGIDAWDYLATDEFDMMITDWEMEPEDGPTLIRRLRIDSDSPARYIPVIMLTGYTEKSKVMNARDFGITEFLAKPLAARSLHARIVNIIENPRPFVRTASFFGPCRRRLNLPSFEGSDRRGSADDAVEI